MRCLGMDDRSGGINGQRTRLRNQMTRFFHCTVQLMRSDGDHEVTVSSLIADKSEYWWNAAEGPDRPGLFDSTIRLWEEFLNEVIKHPVPLDMNILRALKHSPLGLDLYVWLVYRTFTLTAPITLTWRQLFRQFGADPSKASNKKIDPPFRVSGRLALCLTGFHQESCVGLRGCPLGRDRRAGRDSALFVAA